MASSRTPSRCKVLAKATDNKGYDVVVYGTQRYNTVIVCPNRQWGRNVGIGTLEDVLRVFYKEVKTYGLEIIKGGR